jgi:mRNA interferase RelE/StbE
LAAAKVDYKASVAGDLERLDPSAAHRILRKIERTLGEGLAAGEPLAGEFEGLHRIRVGDYRVIYSRTVSGYLILRIGHRGVVYRRGRP